MMSEQSGDLKQYVQAVLSRLWLVVLLMVVAVGAVYSRGGRVPPSYTATATLIVTAPVFVPLAPLAGEAGEGAAPSARSAVQDVVQLIDSRPVASRVAARLNLDGPGAVERAVSATTVRNTSLVRITATATNPQLAAELANVTAEEFVAFFRETNRASVSEARRFVEEQLRLARARLEASERAIQAFRESRQIPALATSTTQVLSEIAASQSGLDAARLQLRETETRLAAARTRLEREQPVIVASRSTSDNPVFSQYQNRLVQLELQRATLAQTYTPQHPRMEQIAREIAEVRSRLTAEARTAIAEEITVNNPVHATLLANVASLEVDRTAVAARVQALEVMHRRRQAAGMSVPGAETEFNRLTRENRVLEANYQTLSTRYQEILLRENQAGFFPASLHLVEPAAAPNRPVPSSLPRTAAAAALAGMVLGVVVALMIGSLDDSIRGARDAELALGVPVLAQVPAQGNTRLSPAPAAAAGILLALVLAALAVARGHVALPQGLTEPVASVLSGLRETRP